MSASQVAAVVLFWMQVVSGIAATIFCGQFAYKQWKRVGKVDVNSLLSNRPRLVFGLIAFSIASGIVGLWLTYSIPRPEKSAPCPTVSANPNSAPATQKSAQAVVTEEVKQPPKRKDASTPAPSVTVAHLNPAPQTTYEQKCEGSACAQGPGSQATLNLFGEPKREIEPKHIQEIMPTLTSNLGEASILSNSNGDKLAQQLFKLFVDAGWKPVSIGSIMGQALPDGILVKWRGPYAVPGTRLNIPADRPDVAAILYALSNSSIKGLAGSPDPNMPEHKISFEIGGAVQ